MLLCYHASHIRCNDGASADPHRESTWKMRESKSTQRESWPTNFFRWSSYANVDDWSNMISVTGCRAHAAAQAHRQVSVDEAWRGSKCVRHHLAGLAVAHKAVISSSSVARYAHSRQTEQKALPKVL